MQENAERGNGSGELSPRLGERTLGILSALASAVPWAGGPISATVAEVISSRQRERLITFVERLREDLDRLADRLDRARLTSSEVDDRIEEVLREVWSTPLEEKHDLFRGLIVNSALGGAHSELSEDYYAYLIQSLSILHLRVLRFLYDPESYLAAMGESAERLTGGFGSMFAIAFPGVSEDAIRSAF